MTSIKSFWANYCEKSSIHGLRYVIHKEAKPWEKFIWTVLLIIVSFTILVHLYASWQTYSYSSMQIILDNPRYPLSKIDFPAITICSINKILYSKAKNIFLNKYKDYPELRERYENALFVLGMLQYPYYKDLSLFVEKNPSMNLTENISDLMLKLMPSIDEMFGSCFWRGSVYNCSDIMRLQRTEQGFCYSFNSKTSERMANDSKFNPPMIGRNNMFIPLRNNAAGKMTGFEVILRSLVTEYFPRDTRSKGFNIMVHTPDDFPDISNSYNIDSEINQSSRISVSVSHIKAGKSLKLLNEKDRKCFLYKKTFKKNKNEPTYKSNAQDNCYSKCRLETTYEICNCVPYYFAVEEDKRQCGIEDIQCLGNMNVLQRNVQAPEDVPGFPKWSVPVFMNCSCPHPCSFISYTMELRNYEKDFIDNLELPDAYIHIDVHYKERFAISYQRSTKYTTQDLLVTFGGMASLFLGCSLVSLVEIIYIIYKSFLMLKQRFTKVHIVKKQQQVIVNRRYNFYNFSKPLYRTPDKKLPPAIHYEIKY